MFRENLSNKMVKGGRKRVKLITHSIWIILTFTSYLTLQEEEKQPEAFILYKSSRLLHISQVNMPNSLS